MILRRAAFLAAILIMVAVPALCEDCLMGRYDANQTSYTSERLQLPLTLRWEYTANRFDNNPAAPVVSGNTCFFASGDYVYAVDLETGSLNWKYPSDRGLGGSVRGTPAIYGGNVYFGAGDGNLYCIDGATGTFQWAYQTRGSIRCPPVIVDGVIYVGADDNSLYAVDAESGDMMWKPFTARDDMAIGVAVSSGMAVVGCMDGNMYGINASSGKLRWYPFRLPQAPTTTSPVIVDNVVVMAVGNSMYGLALRGGQLRWRVTLPSEAAATPAVDGLDVYVPCRDKKLYAYNIGGRQPVYKWTEPADIGGIPMSSPTIAGDTVYATGSKGVVCAFSALDGSLKWRYVFSPSPINTPNSSFTDASCSPTVANGTLLVLTDDGVLRCFAPDAPDTDPPGVFAPAPANGTLMSGAPPIKMSCVLYDPGSGVDFSSVTMSLDGQIVEHKVDLTNSSVTYQTDIGEAGKSVRALKDGVHTITVTAKDYAGNLLTHEWYFIADSSLPPPRRAAPPVEPGKQTKEPPKRPERPPMPTPPGMPGQGETPGMEMPPPPPPPPMPGGPGGPPDMQPEPAPEVF